MKLKRTLCLMLCLCLLAPLAACGEGEAHERQLFAMDTVMGLTAYGKNAEAGLDSAIGVINSLSAMLDVSPNHLSACIKKSEGETFINILVRRRMETAQALLLTTDLQIQEIARRCGYTDQHYFSYCFKKYSGTSPVALRRARAAGEARS